MFPVYHWFPAVVSQDSNRASLTLGPSQIRTCAVNHREQQDRSGGRVAMVESFAARPLNLGVSCQRDAKCTVGTLQGRGSEGGGRPGGDPIAAALDANGDGQIDKAELRAAALRFPRRTSIVKRSC